MCLPCEVAVATAADDVYDTHNYLCHFTSTSRASEREKEEKIKDFHIFSMIS
jgi:hypothetical protein